MKKQYVLGILFFGALWGVSEAALGGWMYAAGIRQAAPVVLAVIAFGLLTLGRRYVPLPGSSAAMGALAMLFKYLSAPDYLCHLLAIFLLGAGYDVVYSLARGRGKPLIGLAGTYLGFALFALSITYVFRYHWWIAEGWPKVLRYVGISGTIAAACNAAIVPLSDWLGRRLWRGALEKVPARGWAFRAVSVVTAGLWVLAIIRKL
jgi:hypothetical protein